MAKPLLTAGEMTLIKRVSLVSAAGCIGIVLLVWSIQRVTNGFRDRSRSATSTSLIQEAGLQDIDFDAHQLAAQQYLSHDQPQRAVGHLRRMRYMRRGDRAVQLQFATALLLSGSFFEARRELKDLLDDRGKDSLAPAIAARYALSLFYTGEARQSLERLRRCAHHYPDNPEAACYLGQVLAAQENDSREVMQWFETSIRLSPGYGEARYQQARYLMSRGEYVRARDSLLRILEYQPLHAKTHSRLGMAYYYLNQPEMAIKYCRTALALNPHDYNTRYNLGEAIILSGQDPAGALAELRKVLELKPAHVEANFKAGVICASAGMLKEAIGFLERAVDSGGKSTRILLQLAAAYERLGVADKAAKSYRAVLEVDALNRVALQKLRQFEATTR